MSYDLTLFSIPEGVQPEAAYEQVIQREDRLTRALPDPTRATMQQLADVIRTRWPAFVQFQPASPLPWIELNDDELEIQFAVYERMASLTVPYFREPTNKLMECVRCCLNACREERGYVAYDPQLGRVVTVDDLGQIALQYRGVDKALPSLRGRASKTQPWWRFW